MESVSSSANDGGSAFSGDESSWTAYFEEFMASERKLSARGFSSGTGQMDHSSAIVCDATSCPAWTPEACASELEGCKKLPPRKTKKGTSLLDDDPLEDTASSSVNGSKVNESCSTDQQERKERMETAQQEEDVGPRNDSELERGFDNGFNCIEGANECTGLIKRGVCLVPMSMLVDHLG